MSSKNDKISQQKAAKKQREKELKELAKKKPADALSPEDLARAEEFKKKGNEFVAAHKFTHAVIAYNAAININPKNAIYYANRSLCHFTLENYQSALEDATKAIELDSTYTKAYYRRATAYLALHKHKEALKDLKFVKSQHPNDPDAKAKYEECQREVARQQHEMDLRSKYTGKITENLKLGDIVVEPSYTGPHLGDKITKEFVEAMIEEFRNQRLIHIKYAYRILMEAKKILKSLPTVVDINVAKGNHITVCGDTHGQFYDLLNIFEINGAPSDENPYLFNGDFVDRGSFSVEVIFTLLAYKVLYPNAMHLTRGNHESRMLNISYGFAGEVRAKYNDIMFECFQEIFNWLPLAMILNQKVIVLHGGLFSRDGVKLDEIRAIKRNRDIPDEGLMTELLWSDPQPIPGRFPSQRGVGVRFGPDVTEKFLKDNNLELLVRSHEAKEQGYEKTHNGKLITIFSAPNYCDQLGNMGAFIRFESDMKPNIVQFDAAPHPDVSPMRYASPFQMF